MYQPPTILVTGGSGLIGSAIKRQTPHYQQCFFVFASSKDADLTSPAETKALFQKVNPNYVIHLAARVGGVYRNSNEKDRVKMLTDNIAINTNVIACCEEFNVTRAILCLSTCVFPDIPPSGYPFDETALHQGAPHPSNEGYAHAKRLMELHSRLLNDENPNAKRYVCVTPTNVYGSHDNYHLENSHVIPGLIHRAYLAKMSNSNFVLRGTGSALRQFVFSDDLARVIINLLIKTAVTGPVIVAPQNEYSIRYIGELIADRFEISRERIVFDTNFGDGQKRKPASDQRLRNILPEITYTPLEVGIAYSVKWFQNNYDTARK